MRWMLMVLVVCWTCAPARDMSEPAPLEHFAKADEFADIKLSPDGQHLAFSTSKDGRALLVCAARGDSKSSGGIRLPERSEITEFHWVSPTQLIYFTEQSATAAGVTASPEMFSVDHQCQKPLKLHGFAADEALPKFLSRVASQPDVVLISEQRARANGAYLHFSAPGALQRLLLLNVKTGERKPLGDLPLAAAKVLVDSNAAVRFVVGYKGPEMQMLWRPDKDAEWRRLELPELRLETIEPRVLSADGNQVWLTAVAPGARHVALYRLDPAQQKVTLLHAFEGMDVDAVVQDLGGNAEIVGVSSAADQPVMHWLDASHPTARLYQGLQSAFAGQSIEITSASADGALAIVRVSSDIDPGSFFLFDARESRAEFMRAARGWIDPTQMLPKRAVELTARDGLKLHGYVTAPTGKGPFPMVVVPHDDPRQRDTRAFDFDVQLLASRGYAVLQINYRGSSGYGLQFATAGNGEWGARMQDDVTDATLWAIEQRIADARRICIFGKGYGGYAAFTAAVRESKLYRCAIGLNGYYDLGLLAEQLDASSELRAYAQRALGSDGEILRTRSPVHNAKRIEIPLLMIHGDKEFFEDYEHARRMRGELRKHRKPFDSLAVRHPSYEKYDERARLEVYQRILKFLAAHLQDGHPVRSTAVNKG